jgi:hypothetical protein
MNAISLAFGLARFGWGVRRFCRETVSIEAARAAIRSRIRDRDRTFLELVRRVWAPGPRSPYRQLFRAARCEPGDVDRLVAQEGVEGALTALRQAGVYVSFDEFKGLRVAVRGGETFQFDAGDFDNPIVRAHFMTTSGGTRARPTRIVIDLDHIAESASDWALWFSAHGWLDRPVVFLTPEFPGIVSRQLRSAKLGKPYARWFVTGGGGTLRYRLVSTYLQALSRRASGAPRPERVSLLTDGRRIGEELARMAAMGKPPCVVASPATAVRLCGTVAETGGSLSGVTFLLGGEPYTDARKRALEAVGASGVPNYGSAETGPLGAQCPGPFTTDDVHVYRDAFAVIAASHMDAGAAEESAILVTGLRRTGPKVLLNVEIGDTARVARRTCGCAFDDMECTTHLWSIRSSDKLTGDGVTFLVADLLPLLEDELPRRFGGAAGHYQIVETQDPHGLPRYQLLVSPEVGTVDECAIVNALLDALSARRPAYGFMVEQWRQGGLLTVRRERPQPTARGKVPAYRRPSWH